MNYIVLTAEQKDWFMTFLQPYRPQLLAQVSDVEPVAISGDKYVIPLDVLSDPVFSQLKEDLSAGGHLAKSEIREVQKDEFL